ARQAKAQHGAALGELGVRNQHAPQLPGSAGNRSFDAHKASALLSGLEIARPVEIGNQSRLSWTPSQQFPGSLTRSRVIERCEMREPAKMAGCFLGGHADERHVLSAADHASDVSERYDLAGRTQM